MTPPERADHERIQLRQDWDWGWNETRDVTGPGYRVVSASERRERGAKLTSVLVVSPAVARGRIRRESDG